MRKIISLPVNYYIDIALFVFLFVFPNFVSTYRVLGMSSCVVFAIAAVGMDMLWGYTGIMSMGQAVFFGLGGYIAAMTYHLQSGLPDFMKNSGITEVPLLLKPLQSEILGYAIAILFPVMLAALLGKFLLNDKVKGIFLAIITMSLAYLMETWFNNMQKFTGGSNGIAGIKTLTCFGRELGISGMYYFNVTVLLLIFILCLMLSRTRFGKALDGIKQNETRMLFLGYNIQNFKIVIFMISAAIGALAGILYVHTTGTFTSQDLGMTMSTLFVIYVAIGGKGHLTGAVFGAILLGWMERITADAIGDIWQLVVGILLLLIVLFMPEGVIGKLLMVQEKVENGKSGAGGR